MELNTNLRRIKVLLTDGEPRHTLESRSDISKDNLLCNYCGWRDKQQDFPRCKTFAKLAKLENDGFGTIVRRCSHYQPLLTFKGQVGMSDRFNTFRLGRAWSARVEVGTTVSLVDVETKKSFGKAVVESLGIYDMETAYLDHAQHNHLMLDKDADYARANMDKLLRSIYGNMFVASANAMSVIYLKRIYEEQGRAQERK